VNRIIRLASLAFLVCSAAVGGYLAGMHRQRQLHVNSEETKVPGPIAEASSKAQPSAAGRSKDGGEIHTGAQHPISLRAMLAEARQRLTGGMINIGSIVDVFDSMGAIHSAQMPEIMSLIDEMPNFQQKNLLYMAALTRWADEDGAGAADYVNGNFDAERRAGMLGAVFSSWAATEPLTGWKWFDANRDEFANPAHAHPLVRSLYQGLATSDFAAAMTRLKLEDDFDLRTVAVEAIGAATATSGHRDAFLDYAKGLENKDQRVRAVNSVLGHMAHSDPAGASSLVEMLDPGKERAEAAKQVANAWFETDPETASTWFLSQVPDDQMPDAIRDITNRWLRRDPNAAGEFLSQIEQGEQSDPARAAFSQGIVALDPESALTWAGTITDNKMRDGSLVNIYKQWRRRDPQAADASLGGSGLSEEQLQKVLEK
jgi:hypothetical protein